MLALTVIQGPDEGRKYLLPPGEPQLIGRSTEALPLADNTVSRRHAELTPDGLNWYIRDLHSQNGTFVNGVPIRGRISLQSGDHIRTGSTVFVYGHTRASDPAVVRIIEPGSTEPEFEVRLASSNEDSMILSEPEPRAAAVDHLRIIYEITSLTTRIEERGALLRAVLALVFEEIKPERGVIMLGDGSPGGALVSVVHQITEPPIVEGAPVSDEPTEIHISRTILKAAVEEGHGVLSSNAMADPRFKAGDSVQNYQIRSAICSPITFGERTFGAIYIDSSIANYTFTKEQLALLNAIGRHTALALANMEQTTRRVRAERLAAIGETVASLSHSIKNILQGLRGGADVVEIGLKKDDLTIARGGWDIQKRNIDRIVSLTMNMLAFSRQKTLDLELTRVGTLVEECAELLERQSIEKNVALIVDADSEMPPIPVDPSLLHQAVMNLIGNAIEAVEPESGMVTVRVVLHEPGGMPSARAHAGLSPWVEIRVMDNGPGIPQDRLRWIFEPFNTTRGTRGTGLGLAVTRQIVAQHRGRIRVETAEGKGSTFRVLIPADLDTQTDPSATTDDRTMPVDF